MTPAATDAGVTALAADHVREAIRGGRLKAGDRIIERTVAEELGISSIAVRDAFARLIQEGWIERVPRRGVRVRRLDGDAIEDISAVRALLEGDAAVRAANRIDGITADDAEGTAALDLLAGIPAAMDRAARRRDRAALLALDDAFHAALWHLAGSPTLEEMLQNLRARITPLIRRSLDRMPDDELLQLGAWHADLVDAVRVGGRTARTAAAVHVNLTRERVLPADDPGRS